MSADRAPGPKQQGADFYNRLWAGQWRELPSHGPLSHSRQRLMIREMGPLLEDESRLLDIGCGDATFLYRLAARYPTLDLHGVDFSTDAFTGVPKHLRARLREGNVERLEETYPASSFDLVTCCEVLEHVEDPAAVLRGMVHLLREGGLAVITVPLGEKHWSDLDDDGGHLRRFELDEFARLVEQAGLRVEKNYGWGRTVALAYYNLTKRMGAKRVARTAKAGWAQLAARVLQVMFYVDDLFPSADGFQLVTRARR